MPYVKLLDYDPYNPLPSRPEDERLEMLLAVESSSMVAEDYEQVGNARNLRIWASFVIYKYSMCENLDAFIPYLALNYFDRYISHRNPVPIVKNDIIHDVELLAFCCLTLAWKMRDNNFRFSELQARQPHLANLTSLEIRVMELQILKGLGWHLRVVTALCFVPYYAPLCLSPHGFNRRTINEIIVQMCPSGLSVTKRKPSVIAASALVAATKFLYPQVFETFFSRVIEEEIIRENHEREFVPITIALCKLLKLVIESDVIENESDSPGQLRLSVRAGKKKTPIQVPTEEASEMDFPIRWRLAEKYGEVFVIFSTEFGLAWPQGTETAQEAHHLVGRALSRGLRNLHKAELCLLSTRMFERYCHCCEVL